jgi:hypothetical protein
MPTIGVSGGLDHCQKYTRREAGPQSQGSHADRPAANEEPTCLRTMRQRRVALCALSAAVLCLPHADTASAAPRKQDRTKPVVAFEAPTAGTSVSGSLSGAACEASATDKYGVDRVEFSVDGAALNVDRGAPYTCAWDTTGAASGQHKVTARAVDTSGNAATTDVTVSIVASEPTPAPTLSTGFPDASNTGVPAGITLTAYTGPSTIATAGTVIDGKTAGCLEVQAVNVIVRNSKITCPGGWGVSCDDSGHTYCAGGFLRVEDSEISCSATNGSALVGAHIIARRVNVHGCENGASFDSDVTIEDSYIHDLFEDCCTTHTDGIQLMAGHDVTMRHNQIISSPGATAAIFADHVTSGNANYFVADNLLAGGGFALYCPGGSDVANFQVTGNRFSTVVWAKSGEYGPATGCQDEVYSDNLWYDGPNAGNPIPG